MRFVVSGASGLIGRSLVERLRTEGHLVTVLVRSATSRRGEPGENRRDEVPWDPDRGQLDPEALDGCQVFVNLSGVPIGEGRWNERRREQIIQSRVQPTAVLAGIAATLAPPDGVLVNASAVGWYGDRGDEELTEQSATGSGFLADLCRRWEQATAPADQALRVVHLRSGVVMTREGGALKKQLPLFRLGLGGRLGTGRQWISWISLEDEVGAIRHAALTPELRGPVNVVAPQPVTNAELTRDLARAVHRPAVLSVPSPVLRAAFGSGFARELLLASQRVRPVRLLATGYEFASPDLVSALAKTMHRTS